MAQLLGMSKTYNPERHDHQGYVPHKMLQIVVYPEAWMKAAPLCAMLTFALFA